jgi:hypothetical protein
VVADDPGAMSIPPPPLAVTADVLAAAKESAGALILFGARHFAQKLGAPKPTALRLPNEAMHA